LRSVEEQIVSMGNDLITKGAGASPSLASLLAQPGTSKQLSFCLYSDDGRFVYIGPLPEAIPSSTLHREKQVPPVADSTPDKHFVLSMTPTQWHVHSSFTTGTYTWYSTVTLDITSPSSTPLRGSLFKIADYFTSQCRVLLRAYVANVTSLAHNVSEPAKELLEKLTSFSSQVKSAMLLDAKGKILSHFGNTAPSADLGKALATMFSQTKNELFIRGTISCESFTICDHEYTIIIAKITNANLYVVVSSTGPRALVISRFLAVVGESACVDTLLKRGHLAGIPAETYNHPLRIQESWFTRPLPTPQGILAGIQGSPLFHMPECQALYRAIDDDIIWFQRRSEPLHHGLHPCPTCEP